MNFTKKEWLAYQHIPANTACELAGNPISSAITTWYLLYNLGDTISFVSDTYDDWPFTEDSRNDLIYYQEVTDRVISELIDNGILIDEGREIPYKDEPELYVRKLRNTWLE